MRRIFLVVLVASAVSVAVVVGFVNSAGPSTNKACAKSSDSGSICNTIFGTGLTSDDVIALFTLPERGYLTHTTWDFETTTYRCDPRGRTKSQCAPDATYRGSSRSGNPPETPCPAAVSNAQQAAARRACSVPVVAGGYASHGELGFAVPWTLRANHWVCVEVSRLVSGKWTDNGSGDRGVRACNEVHA